MTSRALSIISTGLLLAIGISYYLTYEPAPVVGIEWRLGITTDERRSLERRYGLAKRRVVQGRMQYDLMDSSPENTAQLVDDPNVVDTDGIDRRTSALPVDYRYGEGWTWIGDRVRLLRRPGVLPGVVVVLLVILAVAQLAKQKSQARPQQH